MAFAENDARYKCCCGCCHCRLGAIAIAVVELIIVIWAFTDCVTAYINNGSWGQSIFSSVLGLVLLIIVILVIVGHCKQNHVFYLPHLVVSLLFAAVSLAIVILLLVGLIDYGPFKNRDSDDFLLTILQNAAKVKDQATDGAADSAIDAITLEGSSNSKVFGVYPSALFFTVLNTMILYTIVFTISIWAFFVMRGAYRYYKDKRTYEQAHWEGVPLQQKA